MTSSIRCTACRRRQCAIGWCCASTLLLLLLFLLSAIPAHSAGSTSRSLSTSPLGLVPSNIRGGGGLEGDDNHHKPQQYDFDRLSKLLQRLVALETVATDILLSFYDDESSTFATSGGGGGGRRSISDTAENEEEVHDNDDDDGVTQTKSHNTKKKKKNKNNNKRICVTSTCYALLSLKLLLEDTADVDVTSSSSARDRVVSLDQTVTALLTAPFREDDLFQIPLLLYTILFVDTDRSIMKNLVTKLEKEDRSTSDSDTSTDANSSDEVTIAEKVSRRLQTLIRTVLDARPHRHYGIQQANSDYVVYQICKSIALMQKQQPGSSNRSNSGGDSTGIGGLPKSAIPKPSSIAYGDDSHDISLEVYFALLRCAEVSSNELCRQIAYWISGDITSFDVIRLVYSLLTYVRSTESLSGIASIRELDARGIAGNDNGDSMSRTSETKVVPLNKKLVKKALATFFEEQNPKNGLWVKGQPIYKQQHGSNYNIGNAFVFPVNTVGSLLCALPAEYFRPHLGCLERTLTWIESHQITSIVTEYCDINTGQCYGKPIVGWNSPHYTGSSSSSTGNSDSDDPSSNLGAADVDGPQAWSTAQVIKCIVWMKRTISQLLHNDVLEEFHGVRYSKNGIQTAAWDRLLDSDLGSKNRPTTEDDDADTESSSRTIKSVLEERVVTPFATSIRNPSYGAAYSAILFGPPGTAKTTICEALAQRMGYDFVVIDTSTFLANGLTNVAARIRYVFTRLMALNKCIILFDEIEEFVLDREISGLSMESRMLTTAMLTAINDLRKQKQSIFFVATNRLQAFDKAITRPGRFDMQLFVGTPNLNSRVKQFHDQLSTITIIAAAAPPASSVQQQQQLSTSSPSATPAPLSDDQKIELVDMYRNFLEDVWLDDAMFMNYLEGMQFATACAKIAASGNALTYDGMTKVLKQQAAVMTVRKNTPARDDFITSMGLSRL